MVGGWEGVGNRKYNTFTSNHVDLYDFTAKMCTSRLSSPLPSTKNRPLQKQVHHLHPTTQGNKQEPINGEPQKLFTFIEKVR